LIFKGQVVDEKIKYFVQLEGKSQDGVQLADVKLGFKYVPYVTFWIGRFLPHFQYWTPQNTAKLYMIDYPLASNFFGVKRHTGFELAFNHDYVDMYLGLNNGHNYQNMANTLTPAGRDLDTLGNQTWTEENTSKDLYFWIDGKPIKDMHIFAGVWYGTPLDFFENDKGNLIEHNAGTLVVDGGFGYAPSWGLRLWLEAFYSQVTYDAQMIDANTGDLVDRDDDTYEVKSLSFYARAGYNIEQVSGVPLEFLVQYDYLDPDTLNDKDKHGGFIDSEMDVVTQVTGAINYYIEDWHAMVYVNYIAKMEDWEEVGNLEGNDTQNGISNDEVKIVWQVAF
jgi:hypothetical protein